VKHGVYAMNFPVVRTMSEIVEFAVVAEEAGWDGVSSAIRSPTVRLTRG